MREVAIGHSKTSVYLYFQPFALISCVRPGELAHSCNPSYREARTVWWREVYRPLPHWVKDFYIRTMAFLLWKVKRGGQSSPMKKKVLTACSTERRELESRPSSQYCNKITVRIVFARGKSFFFLLICFLFSFSSNKSLYNVSLSQISLHPKNK